MTHNSQMEKTHLADASAVGHGPISHQVASLDGVEVTLVTFGVGAVASGGALGVRMAYGSSQVFRAGDVMMLPPGHNALDRG